MTTRPHTKDEVVDMLVARIREGFEPVEIDPASVVEVAIQVVLIQRNPDEKVKVTVRAPTTYEDTDVPGPRHTMGE